MDRKGILKKLVVALGICGMCFCAYPFALSMRPSAKAMNDSIVVISMPDLEPGKLATIDVEGHILFLLKPDAAQNEAVLALDEHVWNASIDTYNPDLGAYVYWGHSSRWDCPLKHHPAQPSRLLDWEKDALWLGGYWDWVCEVSYDYSGRAIKTYQYTYNGYNWKADNLHSPSVFQKNGAKYVVSKYPR